MRTIEKGREPTSLQEHRRSGGNYSDFTQTDEIRRALLDEQGHLCCFCMQRIVLRGMKIAHWASQSGNPDQTVSWDNLLGACKGGDGKSGDHHHCDTAQGPTPIKIHPADRTQQCERFIQYLSDGTIKSDDKVELSDPEIHNDLLTLKLNYEPLRKARRAIYSSAISQLMKTQPGLWSRADLIESLKRWKQRDETGMLLPFCQVAIYVLKKKLDKRKV